MAEKLATCPPLVGAESTVLNRVDEEPSLLNRLVETSQRAQSIRATAAQFLGVPAERACDLLRQVWRTSRGQPELTDQEMFVGMSMIARFGLDPIAREIYVTRTQKGLATIIGIDGWIKILDRTEGYDGFEQQLEWNGDTLVWVETRIYSKVRSRPTVYRAFSQEYAQLGGFMLEKIPWHMLRVFSLRHAARLFTPLGCSVVTEEEARWMDAYSAAPADRTEATLNKLRGVNHPVPPAMPPAPAATHDPVAARVPGVPSPPPVMVQVPERRPGEDLDELEVAKCPPAARSRPSARMPVDTSWEGVLK